MKNVAKEVLIQRFSEKARFGFGSTYALVKMVFKLAHEMLTNIYRKQIRINPPRWKCSGEYQ